MKKVYGIVRFNPLFNGIGYSEFEQMLRCIDAGTKTFVKGEYLLLSGDLIDYIGLILSGSVRVIKEDVDGNAAILTELAAPEIFGEVFACAGVAHSPVTVQASGDCEVLYLNYRKVISSCSSACHFHSRLIENMLESIAKKTMLMSEKIEILSKRTTREKLLAFFDFQRGAAKKFAIPYNREELARYLCVDRSAMSNELGKMRDEGLLSFHKNVFELH